MEDSLLAYDRGRVHGFAGQCDEDLAVDPHTGSDYRIGVTDGQLTLFEVQLLAAVRRALDVPDATS